jgi:hypothetical protein
VNAKKLADNTTYTLALVTFLKIRTEYEITTCLNNTSTWSPSQLKSDMLGVVGKFLKYIFHLINRIILGLIFKVLFKIIYFYLIILNNIYIIIIINNYIKSIFIYYLYNNNTYIIYI